MSLFFKHLLRTLRRAPIQPLLILLTVVFSTSIAITAFSFPTMYAAHLDDLYGRRMELGDLAVTLRGDSHTRMLFAEDAEALIGEDGSVLGEFRLTGFLEEGGHTRTVAVSAVDLLQADAFYRFHYSQYGCFTTQNLRSSAILSQQLSDELGIGVGDTLCLRVLEEEYVFTIQAVAAEEGLLTDCDLLVPISALTHTLSQRVPAIASLGDSFTPYTRLLISLKDSSAVSLVAERLAASDAFSDKLVERTDSQVKINFQYLLETVSLWVPALLLLLLTGILVGTSMNLMRAERSSEYWLFSVCGATRGQLERLQIGESLLYALLGGVGGVLLSVPLLRITSTAYAWQSTPLTVGVKEALFGLLWAFVLMVGTTLLHLRRHRRAAQKSGVCDGAERLLDARYGTVAIATLALLFFASVIAVSPAPFRYIPAIITLLTLVVWAYLVVPLPLSGILCLVERLMARTRHPAPAFFLASRGLRRNTTLRQVTRMTVLLFALVLTITVCTMFLRKHDDKVTDLIRADFVVINADEKLERLVAEQDGVLGVLRFSYHSEVELDSGRVMLGLSMSGEPNGCLDRKILPKRVPRGNEIALSTGIATMMEVDVGDYLTITVKGCSGEFRVCEIVESNVQLSFFDASTLGIKNDSMCVLVDESYERERLTSMVEPYGSAVIEDKQLFGNMIQTLRGYLVLLNDAVFAAVAVALTGIANLLAEQFRARKEERGLWRMCGMTRLGVLRTSLCELAVVFLFSVVVSLPLCCAMCQLVDIGSRSFGMALFP